VLYNRFTGYSRLEIRDGVAHVFLTGTCTPEGRDFTIANLIILNLKQFPEIQFVKIYDENGTTQDPNGLSDSISACLQPQKSRKRLGLVLHNYLYTIAPEIK
jgi:hypothetical protein